MPTLGEVVGALLSDVAQARVRADQAAVRVARAYRDDPIMKQLSIPRVRLPEVVIDLPLLVSDVVAGDRPMDWSVEVIVGAAEIKERGEGGNIVRVRLTVTEDAYEIVDRDGEDNFLLTPE